MTAPRLKYGFIPFRRLPVALRVFSTALLALWLWLLFSVLGAVHLALSSASWPVARGLVLRQAVVSIPDGRGHTDYTVSVDYNYSVNRRQLYGRKLADEAGFDRYRNAVEAQRVLNLRRETELAVHFDPARPERSLLVVGISRLPVADFLLTLAFLAVPALLWHDYSTRKLKREAVGRWVQAARLRRKRREAEALSQGKW